MMTDAINPTKQLNATALASDDDGINKTANFKLAQIVRGRQSTTVGSTNKTAKQKISSNWILCSPASRPSIHPSAGTQQKQSSSNRNSNICVFCWPQRASERMGRVCACMCFYFIHIHSSIDINSPNNRAKIAPQTKCFATNCNQKWNEHATRVMGLNKSSICNSYKICKNNTPRGLGYWGNP